MATRSRFRVWVHRTTKCIQKYITTTALESPQEARGGGRWIDKTWVSTGTIGIVGCGGVGAACASSLIHRCGPLVRHIVMYDRDTMKCRGEVLDIGDQASFHNTQLRHATAIGDMKGCDIFVIAAGAKCSPGESRRSLTAQNASMLHGLMADMLSSGIVTPQSVFVVATNQVDILTALIMEWLSQIVHSNQIIGSGTYVDSQRLRVLLSKRLSVPPRTVQAFVLGEHGDSQVASYDMVTVGTGNLEQCGLNREEFSKLAQQTRERAQCIVHHKGHTRHCVGECVAAICNSILQDTRSIVPVSSLVPSFGCVFGWPAVLGRTGAERCLPVKLTQEDHDRLLESAASLNYDVSKLLEMYPALTK